MFSGIIGAIGRCASSSGKSGGRELVIACPGEFLEGVAAGASIALNGACQTVTGFAADRFTVFASDETLGCTSLGSLATGSRLHLERALAVTGRLDGHLVSGHVDCTAPLVAVGRAGQNIVFTVRLPRQIAPLVAAKGSLAVDGVSLTVHEVRGDEARFVIIPGSIERTLIGEWRSGQVVNLEADVIARYVARRLETARGAGPAPLLGALESCGYEPDMKVEE